MAENSLQLFPHVWAYCAVFRENLGRVCSNFTIWQKHQGTPGETNSTIIRRWAPQIMGRAPWTLYLLEHPNRINALWRPQYNAFGDDGSHRLAYTSHGLVIDSSTRIPVLLKGDKACKKGGIEYKMLMAEGQQPLLSYTVCLLSYTHELLWGAN